MDKAIKDKIGTGAIVSGEAGKCPVCTNKASLVYDGESDRNNNGEYYEWSCAQCGAIGTEHYDSVFAGHTIESA